MSFGIAIVICLCIGVVCALGVALFDSYADGATVVMAGVVCTLIAGFVLGMGSAIYHIISTSPTASEPLSGGATPMVVEEVISEPIEPTVGRSFKFDPSVSRGFGSTDFGGEE